MEAEATDLPELSALRDGRPKSLPWLRTQVRRPQGLSPSSLRPDAGPRDWAERGDAGISPATRGAVWAC